MNEETVRRAYELYEAELEKMITIYDCLRDFAVEAEEILAINAYYDCEYNQIVKRLGMRLRGETK